MREVYWSFTIKSDKELKVVIKSKFYDAANGKRCSSVQMLVVFTLNNNSLESFRLIFNVSLSLDLNSFFNTNLHIYQQLKMKFCFTKKKSFNRQPNSL